MNTSRVIRVLGLCLVATMSPARAGVETVRGVNLEFVTVGNPGNAADTTTLRTTGAGAVSYTYDIGKYETTAAQWTSFLNIVDPSGTNTLKLWGTNMENNTAGMQINNNGTVTGQHYAVTSGSSQPVVFTNWQMAARFCNYLTSGNTEAGPYLTTGGTGVWTVNRSAALTAYQTIYVLPTLDEWYKAAYHTGSGTSSANYWDYPIQADVISTSMANYGNLLGHTTDAGAWAYPSAYGTYDQGGNAAEWLETQFDATRYFVRGGSWSSPNSSDLASNKAGYQVPIGNGPNLGFRLARIKAAAGFVLPTPVYQTAFVEASAAPLSSLPAFCSSITDPQTGYSLTRLGGTNTEMTGTFAMPAGTTWNSDHGKHWYNMMPAVNCDDSMVVSNARNGAAAVWDAQSMKLLGWIPAVGSTTYPETTNTQREVLWDKLDPNKYYFCTQNRIMVGTIARVAGPPATVSVTVAPVYTFTGYDLVSFGDTKGDISRDNQRMAVVGKKTGVTTALTVIAFQLNTLTISGTRDIADTWDTAGKPKRWADTDGVMVDPTGQYMVYDSGATGIYSIAWGNVGNSAIAWTHVTTADRHGELVVGPDNVTPYWCRNSNMNGVRAHLLSQVDQDGISIWTVGHSDGHMSGVDGWPGKFLFSRYKDGGIYLLDIGNPGYSYYLGNSRHYKVGTGDNVAPASYGQQPKPSISASGRTIIYISDNGDSTATSDLKTYCYGLKMPTQ